MRGDPRKLYILLGILIGGVLVIVYFIIFPIQSDDNEISDDIGSVDTVNVNTNANENTNTAPVPTSGPLYDAARARDTRRVSDIRTYWSALQSYFNDNGNYPTDPNVLVPDYLMVLPQDPKTNQTYVYTPIGVEPSNFFSVWYELEVGIENISAGEHEATPQSYLAW
ncbi:hypothetical protein KKG41_03880 [Patescibacteria group bacterium]|nr:hypothetical protein [Patescibacteria group bacterium]MBU1890554.1 hypothetical protein [Patescibacteria group bacterium]